MTLKPSWPNTRRHNKTSLTVNESFAAGSTRRFLHECASFCICSRTFKPAHHTGMVMQRLRTVSISAPCSSCVSGASSATARNQKRSRFTARSYCCAAISETSTAPASSLSRLHSMIASAYVSLRSIQWNKCSGAARRFDLLRLHFGQASTKLNVLVCANREYGKKWSTSQLESNLRPH